MAHMTAEALAELFRRSAQPFLARLADGRVLAFNKALCDLLGYSPAEVERLDWRKDWTVPESRAHETAMLEKLLRTKKPVRYEKEYVRKDGSRLRAELLVELVSADDGSPAYYWTIVHSLGERKRDEEVLQTTLQRLHTLVSSMRGSVLLVGEDRIELANQALCDYFGLRDSPGDLIGLTPAEMIERIKNAYLHPEEQVSRIQEIVGREQPVIGEEIAMQDGRVCLRDFIPMPADGISHGRLWYHLDITERKRAEEALRESEDRYRSLAESAPDAILVHRDGQVLYANPAALELYGARNFEEMAAHNVMKLANPRHANELQKRVRTIMAGQKVPLRETSIIRLDGREVPVEVISSPVQYGGELAAQAMIRDITDRKWAQAEIESLARFPSENPNPILRVSRHGMLMYANQASRTLLEDWGCAVGEMAPETLLSLVSETLGRRKPKPITVDIELDGRIWSLSVAPIVDSGYVNIYGRDVTERKRAEEQREEAQKRTETQRRLLEAVVENTHAGVLLVRGEDLKIEVVNATYQAIAPDKEMRAKTFQEVWPEIDAGIVKRFRRVLKTGEPFRVVDELIPLRSSPTGPLEPRYFTWSLTRVRIPDGDEWGVLNTVVDTTERKRAEVALRLQANALQAAANGIVITDRDGTIQWVNPAFTRLTGYSAAEAIGQNPRVLKSGRHDAAYYKQLWSTVLAGRVWQGEIVNRRKDGSFYTEEMTITPVLDGAGAIEHFIAIKQDVTARKAAEEALERTRSEFLGEISHELKTPLTAIKGCAAMALSAALAPDATETRELFDIIDAQANRLTELVANLLDATRIEGGRLSIEPGPADLAKIVQEARVIFEHSQYPHSLDVMLPPRLPALRADGRRIVQVLSNLFTNAAKYSAPTAPIIVTAESGKGEVTVHVRDAGVGIPGDKMPLLFQKFVQVQERGAKGTGLGLFICKGIVEAHGGRIWAESAGKSKGTVFSFTLPAMAGKAKTTREEKAAGGRRGAARGDRDRPARVVAVDDEPDILHYIEHCLRSARCEVVSTTDPLAAAELVRFHAPDIVLLDMRMPGRSGLEVLEEIRKFSQTPVTFITATQNREDVVRGREFGGTTWLEKPFSPQQLLDHVGLVLARRRKR